MIGPVVHPWSICIGDVLCCAALSTHSWDTWLAHRMRIYENTCMYDISLAILFLVPPSPVPCLVIIPYVSFALFHCCLSRVFPTQVSEKTLDGACTRTRGSKNREREKERERVEAFHAIDSIYIDSM